MSSEKKNHNKKDDVTVNPPPVLEWAFGTNSNNEEALERVKSVSFHSELPYLAASTFDGRITLWHIHHHKLLGNVRNAHGDIPEGHPHHISSKQRTRRRRRRYNQQQQESQYHPLTQQDDDPTVASDENDDEHPNGFPVRSVHFHPQHALLASGGDDTTVCIWDCDNPHKLRPLVSFSGHTDFVRLVAWHSGSLPWIVSASDDTTLRIWDMDQRSCLAITTGHTDYVMSAAWSPSGAKYLLGTSDYLLASASLDGTVRIWDYQNLYYRYRDDKNHNHANNNNNNQQKEEKEPDDGGASMIKPLQSSSFFSSLHTNMDVTALYVMEGHTQAVNAVSFHPTLPIVASASDDGTVRLWRLSETGAWQLLVLSDQHASNVNSCLVGVVSADPHMAFSASEDGSIGVWHAGKTAFCQEQAFLSQDTRLWCMDYFPGRTKGSSSSPGSNEDNRALLVVGHDHGFFVCRIQTQQSRAPFQNHYTEANPARPRARLLDEGHRVDHDKDAPWAHELAEARVAKRPKEMEDQPLTMSSLVDELHDWRMLQVFPRIMSNVVMPAILIIFLVNLPVLTILGCLTLSVLYGTFRCVRWMILRQSSVQVHAVDGGDDDDEESMVALVERSGQ